MKKYNDVNEVVEILEVLVMNSILKLSKKEKEISKLKCKIYELSDALEVLEIKYNKATDIIDAQNDYIDELKKATT